jgi:hypothetical protein
MLHYCHVQIILVVQIMLPYCHVQIIFGSLDYAYNAMLRLFL